MKNKYNKKFFICSTFILCLNINLNAEVVSPIISENPTSINGVLFKTKYIKATTTKKMETDGAMEFYNLGVNMGLEGLDEPLFTELIQKRDKWLEEHIDQALISKIEEQKEQNMQKYNLGEDEYNQILKENGYEGSPDEINNFFLQKMREKITGIDSEEYKKLIQDMKKEAKKPPSLRDRLSQNEFLKNLRTKIKDFFYDDEDSLGLIKIVERQNPIADGMKSILGDDYQDKIEKLKEDAKLIDQHLNGSLTKEKINEGIDKAFEKDGYIDQQLKKVGFNGDTSSLGDALKKGNMVRSIMEDLVSSNAKVFGLPTHDKAGNKINYKPFDESFLKAMNASFGAPVKSVGNNLCDVVKCYQSNDPKTKKTCIEQGLDKKTVQEKLRKMKEQFMILIMVRIIQELIVEIGIEEAITYAKNIPQCVIFASIMNNKDMDPKDFIFKDKEQLAKCLESSKAKHGAQEDTIKLKINVDKTPYNILNLFQITLPAVTSVNAEASFKDNALTKEFTACLREGKVKGWTEFFNFCMENTDSLQLNWTTENKGFTKNLFEKLPEYKRKSCEDSQNESSKNDFDVTSLVNNLLESPFVDSTSLSEYSTILNKNQPYVKAKDILMKEINDDNRNILENTFRIEKDDLDTLFTLNERNHFFNYVLQLYNTPSEKTWLGDIYMSNISQKEKNEQIEEHSKTSIDSYKNTSKMILLHNTYLQLTNIDNAEFETKKHLPYYKEASSDTEKFKSKLFDFCKDTLTTYKTLLDEIYLKEFDDTHFTNSKNKDYILLGTDKDFSEKIEFLSQLYFTITKPTTQSNISFINFSNGEKHIDIYKKAILLRNKFETPTTQNEIEEFRQINTLLKDDIATVSYATELAKRYLDFQFCNIMTNKLAKEKTIKIKEKKTPNTDMKDIYKIIIDNSFQSIGKPDIIGLFNLLEYHSTIHVNEDRPSVDKCMNNENTSKSYKDIIECVKKKRKQNDIDEEILLDRFVTNNKNKRDSIFWLINYLENKTKKLTLDGKENKKIENKIDQSSFNLAKDILSSYYQITLEQTGTKEKLFQPIEPFSFDSSLIFEGIDKENYKSIYAKQKIKQKEKLEEIELAIKKLDAFILGKKRLNNDNNNLYEIKMKTILKKGL
jgi:hypothetical protein